MGKFVSDERAAELLDVCYRSEEVTLTDEHIGAGASGPAAGGWTARQLALIGVAWPPPSGWRRRAVGTKVSGRAATEFIRLRKPAKGAAADPPREEPKVRSGPRGSDREKLEYVARAAILAGFAFRDGGLSEGAFTAELDRLQSLLDER